MRLETPGNFGVDLLPKAGANLTIPSDWQLTLDVDTPELGHIELYGLMLFSTQKDVVLSTGTMANPVGELRAGNATNPHPTKVRDMMMMMMMMYLFTVPNSTASTWTLATPRTT